TAVIAIALYARYRSQKQKHDLVKTFLDKGQEPPARLLGDDPRTRNGDLRRGLVLVATGARPVLAVAIRAPGGGDRRGARAALRRLRVLDRVEGRSAHARRGEGWVASPRGAHRRRSRRAGPPRRRSARLRRDRAPPSIDGPHAPAPTRRRRSGAR